MTAELLGIDSREELERIEPMIMRPYIWDCTRLPYTVLRQVLSVPWQGTIYPDTGPKIDEWQVVDLILSNEKWLRDPGSRRGNPVHWQCGLVTLPQAEIVFPGSVLTVSGRKIMRPKDMPGFELMCGARQDQITIQPSTSAFSQTFEELSQRLLRNLDWTNVMVAGGMVLGTLISVDAPGGDPHLRHMWSSSDVDMYVYGLSAEKATAKIRHVYETFRSNLPAATPTLAVRNAKTITFYARYPLRRIQIVLKLVDSPKDVLLNFDLDICAMGWDGSDVWMLPRAARALKTGCNIFTMNLIHGHYLSERRASQPQRIFKYANKGYGVRILPSYLSSLARTPEEFEALLPGENISNIDIDVLVADARLSVEAVFAERRGTYRVRYSDLDAIRPSRSCLIGFTLFMRHVVYWEMARQLNGIIEEPAWAYVSYEDTYEDNPNNLLNRPEYVWDSSFCLTKFGRHIDQSNYQENQAWVRSDVSGRLRGHGVIHGDELDDARRITCASRMDVLLSGTHDIKTLLLLPSDFAVYANTLVSEVLEELGVQTHTPMLTPAVFAVIAPPDGVQEGLFIWTITSELMWQQRDRRIDELFEALQAFRRVNVPIEHNQDLQSSRLVQELLKRQIGAHDEFEAFLQWMCQA
ncbi:hypothetical protein C8F04DRAFT_1261138 [Mycena alexandri]|uniref:Uncharacterized protein n=1 Tax=Mycena alexandri TaxID=1745969 RepID=A0AAD6SUI3_9AGAR|nr:hypothetical protein C8F04DRAFT_1261138 [Mycena alexandri]